ncbi:MAG: hypothetical protein ACLUQ6_08250, partial [Alistipes onderdonkii]
DGTHRRRQARTVRRRARTEAFANLWRKQQTRLRIYLLAAGQRGRRARNPDGMSFQNGGWGLPYNHWGYFQPTLSLWNAFESGDTRRDATIIYPGRRSASWGRTSYSGSSSYSISSDTGMSFRKFLSPWKRPTVKARR